MATESAERATRQAEAAAWEDTRDERERLADERERPSDERERLADERERLADQDERIADRMSADPDGTGDARRSSRARRRTCAACPRGTGTRAGRQSSERHCARNALTPRPSAPLPPRARTWSGTTRSTRTRRSGRGSVGASSPQNVNVSPTSGSRRPTFVMSWPGCANRRPTSVTGPWPGEESALQRIADVTGPAAGLDQPTDRARHDLAAVREAGRGQSRGHRHPSPGCGRPRTPGDCGWRPGSMRLPYGGYLAAQFAALTWELFASQDLFEVAERVGDLAGRAHPGRRREGTTFFEVVRPMTHVATDDVAHQLDAYQLAREEGPICESLEGGEPVSIGDLAGDLRWPSFRSMAAELGIAGVAACGLAVRRDQDWHPLGALTVYAEAPGAFDDDVGDAVSLFAVRPGGRGLVRPGSPRRQPPGSRAPPRARQP